MGGALAGKTVRYSEARDRVQEVGTFGAYVFGEPVEARIRLTLV